MRRVAFAFFGLGLTAAVALMGCHGDAAEPASTSQSAGVASPQPRAAQLAGIHFRNETIVDAKYGGLVAIRFVVPQDWRATSSLTWTYSDVTSPVRMAARLESPDGSAWIEGYPSELFFWLQPTFSSPPFGTKVLGALYRPDIGAIEALQRFVILRYRGNMQNLRFVGWRPVPNLVKALGKPEMPGEAIAIRVTYDLNGQAIEEEFYGLLSDTIRLSATGPLGTTYELRRYLTYVHSMGARTGKLDSLHPLLGFIAASFKTDPVWEKHAQQVDQQIQAAFQQYIALGYARIQAAAQLSRTITANNAAVAAMMRDQSATRSASEDRIHDNYIDYIRGTERVSDPNRGISEQPNEYRYHWADALGAVQHSNDPSYNPNIGSTTTWRKMEAVP
jgi:hypothetical protein